MSQEEIPMIFRRDTTSTTPKGRSYLITSTEPNVNKILHEIKSKEKEEIIESKVDQHHTLNISSKVPKYVENDKKVLRFEAYFLQPVYESPVENYRVRFCHLLYYLEDDTIQIVEEKIENSGLPSGTILKRQKIPKPDLLNEKGDEILCHWKELNVQQTICIYGCLYRIIDADAFTRDYYATHMGLQLNTKEPTEDIPEDVYTIIKNEQMSRETGKDPNRNYGKIQYPMKQFLEASLGKFHHSSEQCKLFLKYDRVVLRWYCSWDDTASAFGQKHYYMIHYYLTDNTLEVKEIHERNSGYDRFPKLLGRQKLEKKEIGDKSKIEEEKKVYYSWNDFQIGKFINVYGRPLLLLDADNSTRQWYKNEGKLNIENPLEVGKFEVSAIAK